MKRTRRLSAMLFTAVCTILLLSGCAVRDTMRARELRAGLGQSYGAVLHFTTASGTAVTASLERPDPGSCTVEVTMPAHLAGLRYVRHQDGVDISFRELSYGSGIPPPTLPVVVADALSALLAPSDTLPERSEGTLWQLSGEDGVLLLDGKTGLPVKLLLRWPETEIALTDFVFYH